jgi:uncharacterized SAM-binding protein YcdF (DUF218 family)
MMLSATWFRVVAFLVCCTPLFLIVGLFLSYETIPSRDTQQTHFDTIIVLGTPAKADGTPGTEAAQRTLEGIREYHAGVAPHIILTGGPAHNHFIEGQSMADFAAAQGVPREALIVEGQAHDTIQNIYYSKQIMDVNGWKSAEIVSSPSHLPRTALILEHYQFAWATHKAHWPPEYTLVHIATIYWGEATGSWQLRWHGFKPSKFIPGT